MSTMKSGHVLRSTTALVTGGTDGIGKEIARGLATAGHHVVIVGHHAKKGNLARLEIQRDSGNDHVDFVSANLALVSDTQRLANIAADLYPELHVLVLCAGVVQRRELTTEKIEANFAINYLSRFVLIQELLPLLARTGRPGAASRIVLISGATQHGRIYFDDVNLTENFGTMRAVGQFCRANDLLAVELDRRMADTAQPNVTINCLKLGVVKTKIRRNFPWWMKLLVPLALDPIIGQTPQEAAKGALRLLLSKEFESTTGSLFVKVRKFRKLPSEGGDLDRTQGERLWQLSERLVESAKKADAGSIEKHRTLPVPDANDY